MNVETGGLAVHGAGFAEARDGGRRPASKEALRVGLYLALMALDCAAIAIGFLLANGLRFGNVLAADGFSMGVALVPVYLGVALNSGAYGIEVLRSPRSGIWRAVTAFAFAVGTILLFSFYLKLSTDFSRLVFSVGAGLSLSTMAAFRLGFGGYATRLLGSLAGDKLFWEIDQRYWHRHACKPGITGLAQVRGYRGATEQRADLTNRLQSDLEYLAGWTIWRDISILFATFGVIRHKNAF